MAKWLDKYEQGGLVLKQKTKDNYGKKPNPNDVKVSSGPGYVGIGNDIIGRDYSPAWGGQFEYGGNVAQKGMAVPTTADSARLFNNQIALNDFYTKEMKAGRLRRRTDLDLNVPSTEFSPGSLGDLRRLNESNLNFYRGKIKQRSDIGHSTFDDKYQEYFKLSPKQIIELEKKGLAQTKAGSEYQQYYRDLITPLQNLAAPFALVDSRILPQRTINYESTVPAYPGGNVMVYDYDPLAVKPYHMRTDKEKIAWEKKYGKKTEPVKQSSKKESIITNDPKDPRLKAYQDSLSLYNLYEKVYRDAKKSDKVTSEYPYEDFQISPVVGKVGDVDAYRSNVKANAYKKKEIKPITEYSYLADSQDRYIDGQFYPGKKDATFFSHRFKKPVQPVVYKKPEREPVIVNDPNDPKLKAYQDSLSVYNKSKDLYDQLLSQAKQGNEGIREQVRDKMSLKDVTYFGNVGVPYSYKGIKPDYVLGTKTATENRGYLPHYKKPTQPVEYKKLEETKSTQPTPKGSKKYIVNGMEVSEEDFLGSGPTTGGGKRVIYNTPKQGTQKVLRLDGTPETDPEKIRKALATAQKSEEFQDGGNLWNTDRTAWVDSIHNARKADLNFVKRMFDQSAGSIQIPGQRGTSTHFMESGDNKAYPTVVQMPNGKLQYLNQNDKDAAWKYANKTGQFIKFPTDEQAAWYADNGYKKGTGVLKKNQMGGSLPGAVGFTYARVAGSAPANGKYTKKTKASAQNGKEMQFYQDGLDWKPNSIAQDGAIVDPMGQWAHPGEVTIIPDTNITMEGVDYPVLGISDTGDQQMMYPGEDYNFDGEYVTEYPMMQNGGWLNKFDQEKAPSDATRVSAPIRPLTKKEQRENVKINKENKKKTEELNKAIVADRKSKRETKGDVNVPGSFNITEKFRLFPESVGGVGEMFDEYVNPGTIVGVLADSLGESVAAKDPKAVALSLALTAGAGALGLDPLSGGIKTTKELAKVPRATLNTIDRNFSDVGKRLIQVEKKGLEKGWSPEKIKATQMKSVGITSAQREAYVPGISDALEKYIYPQGYSGFGESKLSQIMKAIKYGKREKALPAREDAWRLYLGKPQKSNTFRMAETNPINHPAYTTKQLSNMDIYSINDRYIDDDIEYNNLHGIGPNLISEGSIGNPENQAWRLEQNLKILTNPISQGYHGPVMGGFNRRLGPQGLEYNDIWDLEPELFGKKIKIDKFIGKPFMSHGVIPDVTPESLKSLLTNQIKDADAEFKPMIKYYQDLTDKGGMIDYSQALDEYKSALNRVNRLKQPLGIDQDIIKNTKDLGTKDWNNTIKNTSFNKENGGWLTKYK